MLVYPFVDFFGPLEVGYWLWCLLWHYCCEPLMDSVLFILLWALVYSILWIILWASCEYRFVDSFVVLDWYLCMFSFALLVWLIPPSTGGGPIGTTWLGGVLFAPIGFWLLQLHVQGGSWKYWRLLLLYLWCPPKYPRQIH